MASFVPNTLTGALHGKLDEFIVRRQNGRSILQRRPRRRKPWSSDQVANRVEFASATRFAALVRADPALRDWYRRHAKLRRLNYWTTAIKDYRNPPRDVRLRFSEYEPGNGGEISFLAIDDTEIVRVHVAIRGGDGAVIACGDARYHGPDWRYMGPPAAAGQKHPVYAVATGFDRPGNFVIGQFELK